jgi:hypothetical protein
MGFKKKATVTVEDYDFLMPSKEMIEEALYYQREQEEHERDCQRFLEYEQKRLACLA